MQASYTLNNEIKQEGISFDKFLNQIKSLITKGWVNLAKSLL